MRSCPKKSPRYATCGDSWRTGESPPEAVAVDALIELIETLDANTSELCCHPGYADDLSTSYQKERTLEIATLCDVRVRAALIEQGVELGSFYAAAATGSSRTITVSATAQISVAGRPARSACSRILSALEAS